MQRDADRHEFAEEVVIVVTDVGQDFAAVPVDVHRAVGGRADHVVAHRILRQRPHARFAFGQVELVAAFETDFAGEAVNRFQSHRFARTDAVFALRRAGNGHGREFQNPRYFFGFAVVQHIAVGRHDGYGVRFDPPFAGGELAPRLNELTAPNARPSNTRQAEQQ